MNFKQKLGVCDHAHSNADEITTPVIFKHLIRAMKHVEEKTRCKKAR